MAIDKIICVGQNYLDHVAEMGEKTPEKPVIFLKPASILRRAEKWGDTVLLDFPVDKGELHYECEIVLRVAKEGYQVDIADATNMIDAVTLGLDMTLRTLQSQQKKQGKPWTTSKVFKDAAVIGPWIELQDFPDYMTTGFSFSLNDQIRQKTTAMTMMLKPQELITYISQCFPLCAGDLIFTGTPAGVGPVTPGAIGKLQWRQECYYVKWL